MALSTGVVCLKSWLFWPSIIRVRSGGGAAAAACASQRTGPKRTVSCAVFMVAPDCNAPIVGQRVALLGGVWQRLALLGCGNGNAGNFSAAPGVYSLCKGQCIP